MISCTHEYKQVVTSPDKMLWSGVASDGITSHPGGSSCISSCFMLQSSELAAVKILAAKLRIVVLEFLLSCFSITLRL